VNPPWPLAIASLLPFLSRYLCRRLGLVKPNFQGVPIPAACGLTFVLAAPLALFLPGNGIAVMVAFVFGLLGLLDDLKGDRSVGGFRGHLKALFSGQPTTGSLKLIGGGLTALAGAGTLLWAGQFTPVWAAHTLIGGLLIALSANAVNLLDTRPGRAHFGFALLLLPSLRSAGGVAPLLLTVLIEWPFDARAKSMMGDTGANCLGALAGVLALQALPLWGQALLLTLLLALNIASERFSLQKVIEATPYLAWLDRRLGVRA
jgi:UDP-GlcNAc:undecaprenyl-phosphate/decaprenyl-phosphate GlcNAc-1-phosphate transferase